MNKFNITSLYRFATFFAVAFVLLSPFTAAAWANPQIKDFDQRCVNQDGVVEVELYSVTDATLINDTTGETVDVWEIDNRQESDKNTVFLTYSGLDDGEYTLHIENYDGNTAQKSFTVDCDPVVCEPNPGEDLDLIDFDATAGTATIKNNSELCSYDVGIASYKGFELANDTTLKIDSQELFDDASARLQPKDEKTLDIDVPDCSYQIDVFYGDLITDFSGGDRYGDRKLAWSHENLDNICGEEEIEELELSQQCVPGENNGEIVVTAPDGIDSWELYNTSNPNTPIESGSNVAAGGTVTVDGLADGNYRFEATLGDHDYETLTFTFDCDVEEPDELTGVCEVSPDRVETGEDVTFSADADGGSSPYSFSWDLEGSNDDADTRNITTSYNSEGTFDGTVTITDDNGDQVQDTCSVRVKDDGGGGGGGDRLPPRDDDDEPRVRGDRDVDFGVQCLPDRSTRLVGEVVTYTATIDSDDIDADDVDFDWSGQNGIDEDGETATIQYRSTGIKELRVEAEYDGETESDTCFVQIGRGEGVTLDQVPYTGPGGMVKTIGFITTLLLMALAGGYAIIRRREEDGVPVGIPTKRE